VDEAHQFTILPWCAHQWIGPGLLTLLCTYFGMAMAGARISRLYRVLRRGRVQHVWPPCISGLDVSRDLVWRSVHPGSHGSRTHRGAWIPQGRRPDSPTPQHRPGSPRLNAHRRWSFDWSTTSGRSRVVRGTVASVDVVRWQLLMVGLGRVNGSDMLSQHKR